MSRIGLKEGDTMHAFFRNVDNERNNNPSGARSSGASSQSAPPPPSEGDDFDELARYFLPLAGSLLGKFKTEEISCFWRCFYLKFFSYFSTL